MGIKGLSSFLERTDTSQETVNLSSIGATILVDLSSFAYYFIAETERNLGLPYNCNLLGGEWLAYDQALTAFVTSVLIRNVKLSFYLDASNGTEKDEERKLKTWESRLLSKRLDVARAQKWCDQGVWSDMTPVKGRSSSGGMTEQVPWFFPENAMRQCVCLHVAVRQIGVLWMIFDAQAHMGC